MDTFYHALYGITPYGGIANAGVSMPVVVPDTVSAVPPTTNNVAVFSQAVFTSLFIMSLTTGPTNQPVDKSVPDTVSRPVLLTKDAGFLPTSGSLLRPAEAVISTTSVPKVRMTPRKSNTSPPKIRTTYRNTWPRFPTTTKGRVVYSTKKTTYPPWINSYEYFARRTIPSSKTTKKEVPFHIPMVEKKTTIIPANVEDKVGNPVSNTTLPLELGHIKHDYYGPDFWTPTIVLLSLSIPGILCLYVVIYYMGNRIIQLSSTQRSYEPVSTNVDLTMRLNDVEKQFLLCQRKMEEKEEKEKQKRVRVAIHPGQLLVSL
jgi:hypothetical protein